MPLNVLVVEDSEVMRAVIIRTLRLGRVPLGDIYEAPNGREGLRVLDEKWVDLAFVDINMPVMNGEAMIDSVRNSPTTADLPIVVLSAESSGTRIESLQRKRVKFVHKPFTPEELCQTVLELTGVPNGEFSGESPLSESGPDF